MKNSGSKRIAERYVRALFDITDGKARDLIEDDFVQLHSALEESHELRDFLHNPLLTRDQQTEVMDAVLAKMKTQDVTRKFIALLVRQKRLGILPGIMTLYRQWAQAARGEMDAELIAAAPLTDKDVKLVAAQLGKAYGKKIHLKVKEDPSLLGGALIKIGSLQLDSSLSGKLDRLRLKLKAA